MHTFYQQHFGGQRGRDFLIAMFMGGPAFLLLGLFMIWPVIRGIDLSRTNQRFDGAQAANVGWSNYDKILSVNVIRLPDIPDPLPEEAPAAGWYRSNDGELIFRWRARGLEEIGLGQYADYEIARQFSIRDNQYAVIAKDPLFWKALLNNFYFVLIVVPVQTALALLLALLINQKLPYRNVFRTLYFSPVATAMVIIAVVWLFLYNPQYGLINQMLDTLSGGQLGPYKWLQSSKMAMPAIMIMSIWQGVGFQMIIFLAGLQDIPEDLYEASGIDGANAWQKFRFVTLPMLRNTTIFVVLTTTILAFRLFDQVNVMTPDGGPNESTATMVWYAIRRGWGQSEVGYASAVSIVFVGIVLIISLIQRGVIRSGDAAE
ncbi:MAG TPA: sugar ABC transporter permease [Aggregatilinea sp.]|uniref:carbohydrate ABC transporter permease n=1 Tax=Aggregatilinea sp. TaxID=2806333 RepID=UPI002CD4B59D|nr:sugar ABC transporter permease [Aggregatilinea sp.]HML20576.1 sugar ABC transporter permease [Aggregatilinea sp.]